MIVLLLGLCQLLSQLHMCIKLTVALDKVFLLSKHIDVCFIAL